MEQNNQNVTQTPPSLAANQNSYNAIVVINNNKNNTECDINEKVTIYVVINCLLIVLIVSGNLFIIKTLLLDKPKFRRNMNLFIIYLACFDLLAALMIIVDVYENLTCHGEWSFGDVGCKIIYPCYHISLTMTVCILIIMSVDRCHSILKPLSKKFRRRTIHISVFVSFLVAVTLQWYQFVELQVRPDIGRCYLNREKPLYAFPRLFEVFFRDIIFLIVFTSTTVLIYTSLRKRDFKENKQSPQKVVSALIIMEVTFILLVMPYDFYDSMMLLSRVVPGFTPIYPT